MKTENSKSSKVYSSTRMLHQSIEYDFGQDELSFENEIKKFYRMGIIKVDEMGEGFTETCAITDEPIIIDLMKKEKQKIKWY